MKTSPLAERLAAALCGEIVGSIEQGLWECSCGDMGACRSPQAAALALWEHRQREHEK